MKVVVLGLWYLGCVTAACCAKLTDVGGLDYDEQTVHNLWAGQPPIFEPGLADLIQDGLLARHLSFESDPAVALVGADLLWVSYDTPVDDDAQPDVKPVLERIDRSLPYLPDRAVERGLKSEAQIGPKAYLSPGGPFAGTLAMEVMTLDHLASRFGEELFLIPAIKTSNDQHKNWAIQKLREELGSLTGKRVAILGLTYKPNTDTLRRSLAIELCWHLIAERVDLTAFDPVVAFTPIDLGKIQITRSVFEAIKDAEAMVVATEWPQLLGIDWLKSVRSMKRAIVVDANGFLRANLSKLPEVIHRSVGIPRTL
jgi:UDP-glucose 6-dehydrogenase